MDAIQRRIHVLRARSHAQVRFSDKHILKVAHTAARDCARTPVQWTGGKYAGFSTHEPWYTVNPNYTTVNVEAAMQDENSIWYFYKRILALRQEYKDSAVYGKFEIKRLHDKQLFIYDKIAEDGASKLTVIANVSSKPVAFSKIAKHIPTDATELLSVYDEPWGEKEIKPYAAKLYFTKLR